MQGFGYVAVCSMCVPQGMICRTMGNGQNVVTVVACFKKPCIVIFQACLWHKTLSADVIILTLTITHYKVWHVSQALMFVLKICLEWNPCAIAVVTRVHHSTLPSCSFCGKTSVTRKKKKKKARGWRDWVSLTQSPERDCFLQNRACCVARGMNLDEGRNLKLVQLYGPFRFSFLCTVSAAGTRRPQRNRRAKRYTALGLPEKQGPGALCQGEIGLRVTAWFCRFHRC